MAAKEDPFPAKVWYDVGIPGLKNAMSPEHSKCHRFFWGLSIVICFGACVLQFVERIQFYMESSVATAVRIDVDQSMKHARMTFCPTFFFDNDMTARRLKMRLGEDTWKDKDMCDLLKIDGMTVDKLWDMTGHVNISMKLTYWDFFGTLPQPFTMKTFKSYFGVCKTIEMNRDDVIASSRMIISTNYHDPPPYNELATIYTLTFHDEEVISDLELLRGTEIPTWNEVRTAIEPTKFRNLNTWKSSCVSAQEHFECKKACLEDRLQSAVSCKLPFMKHHPGPTCNTVDTCKTAMKTIKDIYFDSEKEKLCPCDRACYMTKYSVVRNLNWLDTADSQVIVSFRSATMQTMEEFPAFDVVALLCSIGGIVGLFLGFCLLSLLELMESLLSGTKVASVALDEKELKVIRRGFNVVQPTNGGPGRAVDFGRPQNNNGVHGNFGVSTLSSTNSSVSVDLYKNKYKYKNNERTGQKFGSVKKCAAAMMNPEYGQPTLCDLFLALIRRVVSQGPPTHGPPCLGRTTEGSGGPLPLSMEEFQFLCEMPFILFRSAVEAIIVLLLVGYFWSMLLNYLFPSCSLE